MPQYRLFRLRENLRASFRQQPHTSEPATLKPKDYEEGDLVEAPTPYAAWHLSREQPRPLQVGDALSTPEGQLLVYKFIGFDPAVWWTPEPKAQLTVTTPLAAFPHIPQ